ncbi:MAG: hypothetical protein QF402_12025 [Candidatus Latescibacteria bacterium]|jgi:hypothetical protein|nr:hypothetical protein [Candidatus Latescibacterota bacterium]
MVSRRQFLAASAGLMLTEIPGRGADHRKHVAFLGTEIRQHSHAQHVLDRLTAGQAWGGHWLEPRVEVASIYIDQFPEGDLTPGRVERHGLELYPSVADALCLGGSELAVDGVVIIAEHGKYPRNEKGQTRYPRYDWFKEVVRVFEASGRSVPVFNDKHLSTTWDECAEMVADSKRLDFAFLAGSSLPVTWRLPSIDMPHGAPLTESVCVAYGGVDSYDIHALETAQCMSERRQGGEVGITQVQALRGENVWARLRSEECRITRDLFVSALTRSHNLPVQGGYPTQPVSLEWAQSVFNKITAYFIEHRDGFRTAMFLTGIRDFNYAGHRSDTGEIISCQMYLPMPAHGSSTADFFNPLTRHIEDLIINERANYPVERTLLTSGMVVAGVDSLFQNQIVIPTPQMDVTYQVSEESTFWRI